tara:strand:+ start:3079 stop:3669 length:591 start_codon:yes stop_codon:yes gene_type:complete
MSDFTDIIYSTFYDLNLRYDASSHDFSILKLAIIDKSLETLYEDKINKHNENFRRNKFMDSGFDLFIPKDVSFEQLFKTEFVDLGIKAELVNCKVDKDLHYRTTPFFLFPRSSISKTPLTLANQTGIIDAGYRGNLISALRAFYFEENNDKYVLERGTRLVQLCDPELKPIYVVLVDEDQLSTTERGAGGFGSTGK